MKNHLRLALRLLLLLCTLALLPLVHQPVFAQPAMQPHPDVAALLTKADATWQGNVEEGLRLYNEALLKARALNDQAGEARTLRLLGIVYQSTGQTEQAIQAYKQARVFFNGVADKPYEALTLANVGVLYRDIGQFQQALQHFHQALSLQQEAKDTWGQVPTLVNIGIVYESLGQPQQALPFYEQALPLSREAGNKGGEALALNHIGGIYHHATRQPERALRFFEEARSLYKVIGDARGEADTLNNIGWAYNSLDQTQKALQSYEQTLPLLEKIGDRRGKAITLNNIASIHRDMERYSSALPFYEQALSLQMETGDKLGAATTLDNVGAIQQDTGQPIRALEFFGRSLRLREEAGDKAAQATTLGRIAAVEESQGQLNDASRHLLAALTILENMRESLGGMSELKASFLELKLPIYHAYINLLLKQENLVSAFTWTQKVKARSLLDLMAAGRVDISQGASQVEQQRERDLKLRVGQLNQQLIAAAIQTNPDKTQIASLKEQLAQAGDELQHFTDSLYAKYPELARKRIAQTVSLEDVTKLLPPDTALLEYVVLTARGVDKTVLFCVTVQDGKASVAVYPIALTRQQLSTRVADFQAACSKPQSDYAEKARALYDVLIAPAAKQLRGKKRLVICPDGPLWGLPFQALMTRDEGALAMQFLLERQEVSYAYSATAMQAALLAGASLSANTKLGQPSGTLLAMANPNFGGAGRFDSAAAASPTASSGGTQDKRPLIIKLRPLILNLRGAGSGIVRDNGLITSLPGTQLEADAIKAHFPSALIRTGDKAQESTAKAETPHHRYLHFATHGLFNDDSPLESGIVLAQPAANSADDGFLTAREIFDMNMNAELVVLSACNTARGEQRSGEGVVGLTWALFVAGAPTQVLSQWAVADQSTAQLMKSFYTNLKTGKAKGAALRGASLALMKDGKHAHPFYWAPFVLVGDWR
jgi:CHAT domain-containing protein/tetratricopeptide (TPR) repeat protein